MLTARAAHRYCNIADMTPEQRGNRIAIFGVVLEYCERGDLRFRGSGTPLPGRLLVY